MVPFILFIVAFAYDAGYVLANVVSLTNSGPAVRGSIVTFTAILSANYRGEQLKFIFSDDAVPQHYQEVLSADNIVNITFEYNKDIYEAGQYRVNVDVKKKIMFEIWHSIGEDDTVFSLTDHLHGQLILKQNETIRPNSFVAVNSTVNHFIKIPDYEMEFLLKNSSTIVTYWFKDCVYYDTTTDFSLNLTYDDAMGTHDIEAIVVANNKPLPPITTTTTTTTTTTSTTTTTTTTTPKPTTTTVKPMSTSPPTSISPAIVGNDTSGHNITKRAISNRTTMDVVDDIKSYACNNTVPIGKHYTAGRYQQTVKVRVPISTVNITGKNWLQHGDLLNLAIKYTGSPPFKYCIQYKTGEYNVTGNETCDDKATGTNSNEFPLVHYFPDSEQYTVVIIIENDIGKAVSKAAINIYKVRVHPQLSIIVVPVFFCAVAVILVVFGIAYYQHRTRHTIEVADFDFGQTHPDYKTFTERLRDSFSNAFNFRQRDDTETLTNNTRYDSMT